MINLILLTECALVVLLSSVYMFKQSIKRVNGFGALVWGYGVLFGVIMFILIPLLILEFNASQHKAKIINEQYGTSYTQEEIFYAEDIIKTTNLKCH